MNPECASVRSQETCLANAEFNSMERVFRNVPHHERPAIPFLDGTMRPPGVQFGHVLGRHVGRIGISSRYRRRSRQ